MGRKGDLLELIDGAPIGVSTLTGSVWKWTHREQQQRAFMELACTHGGARGIARFGGPVGETSDQRFRYLATFPRSQKTSSLVRIGMSTESPLPGCVGCIGSFGIFLPG